MNAAIFTIVHNEDEMLKLWVKYYSQFLNDIFILNDGSTNGIVEQLKNCYSIQVANLPDRTKIDWNRLTEYAKSFQQHLFNFYEIVIYTDVDEFIFSKVGLNNELLMFKYSNQQFLTCQGIDILQDRNEPDLNFDNPILLQRKYYIEYKKYNKPLISKVPLNWSTGCHRINNVFQEPDDIYLIHLQRADWKTAKKRFLDANRGDVNQFEERYFSSRYFTTSAGAFQRKIIPHWLKHAL